MQPLSRALAWAPARALSAAAARAASVAGARAHSAAAAPAVSVADDVLSAAAAPAVSVAGDVVRVALGASALAFHGAFLRDHCPCAACRHPQTGQRTAPAPRAGLAPAAAAWDAARAGLRVEWRGAAPGAAPHVSLFSRAWLARHAYWAEGGAAPARPAARAGEADAAREAAARAPWRGADLRPLARVPAAALLDARGDGVARALRALRADGLVLVEGVAPSAAATRAACEALGTLRPTLYGAGMWAVEVRAGAALVDTAFTAAPLPLHTDGNYFADGPPALQAFHALVADAAGGGATVLVDGLAAAAALRAAAPDAFALLCAWPLGYHHTGADGVVRAERPVFALDDAGAVAAVAWNDDDREPARVPAWAGDAARARALFAGAPPHLRADLADPARALPALYRALDAWRAALAAPGLARRLALRPGTLLVFDNTRVLHGRDGFANTSGRTLVGAYLDADGWQSRLRLEERRLAGEGAGE